MKEVDISRTWMPYRLLRKLSLGVCTVDTRWFYSYRLQSSMLLGQGYGPHELPLHKLEDNGMDVSQKDQKIWIVRQSTQKQVFDL